jgi:ribosomal protein L7/L12
LTLGVSSVYLLSTEVLVEISSGELEDIILELSSARRNLDRVEKRLAGLLGVTGGTMLYLVSVPEENWINVIKAIRELTGVGLKEAKAITDSVRLFGSEPQFLKNVLTKSDLNGREMRTISLFEQCGAKIEWRHVEG